MLALCVVTACKEKENAESPALPAAGTAADVAKPAAGHEEAHKATEANKAVHLKIEGAKIPATTADTAAMFFTVKNDGAEDKLVRAAAEGVKTVELHESKMENGVAKMESVKDVAIGANKSVVFEHGGFHVMLIGLPHGGLKEGGKVKVTLTFEKAKDVVVDVPVVAPHAHAEKKVEDKKDDKKPEDKK